MRFYKSDYLLNMTINKMTPHLRSCIKEYWPVGVILVILGIIYGQAFTHEFNLYDDPLYITENSYVVEGLTWEGVRWAFVNNISANWHPLTWVSHMIDCEFFGLHAGFHIGENVLWHSMNAVLVYLFALRLFAGRKEAFFIALVFAIHPQNIEAVAWASQRKSLLNVFFTLLALIAYLRYVRAGRFVAYGVMLITFMVSLTAKSMSVTLPVLLCLLDVWPLRRVFEGDNGLSNGGGLCSARVVRRILWLLWEKLPLFIISAWIGCITILYQDTAGAVVSTDAFPLWARFGNALLSYGTYLKNAVYPSDLCLFYSSKPLVSQDIGIAAGGLLLLTAIAIFNISRRPGIMIGWVWFVITLLPVIGILQVGMQSRADRYFYFPSIGLLIMITSLLPILRLPDRAGRLITYGVGGVWVVSLMLFSYGQLKLWKTSTLLLSNAWESGGVYPGTILNLSSSYYAQARFKEALHAVDVGIAEFPLDTNLHANRAAILLGLNRPSEALEVLDRLKTEKTYSFQIYLLYADTYHRIGDDKRAMQCLKICKILLPSERQWRLGLEEWRRRLGNKEFTLNMLYSPKP